MLKYHLNVQHTYLFLSVSVSNGPYFVHLHQHRGSLKIHMMLIIIHSLWELGAIKESCCSFCLSVCLSIQPYCWHESSHILLSLHCNWGMSNLCDSSGYWSSRISLYLPVSRADLWIVIENISDRLTKVDKVQFMTQDVVQKLKKHFMDIRLASGKWVGLHYRWFKDTLYFQWCVVLSENLYVGQSCSII